MAVQGPVQGGQGNSGGSGWGWQAASPLVRASRRDNRRHERLLHVSANGKCLLRPSLRHSDDHPAAGLQHKLRRREPIAADTDVLLPTRKHHLAITLVFTATVARLHWRPRRALLRMHSNGEIEKEQ